MSPCRESFVASARGVMAEAAPRPRAWQRMLSGRRLDLLNPSPADVAIEDIAHGLARVPRWNGQTFGPHVFSVAQHSLLVEAIGVALDRALSQEDRLALVLHDAPEYVIGDLISPFKAVVGDAYRAIEARLLDAIHAHFALPIPSLALKDLIKRADRAAAWFEATGLAGFSQDEALGLFGRHEVDLPDLADHLRPLASNDAEAAFLARVRLLDGSDSRWDRGNSA